LMNPVCLPRAASMPNIPIVWVITVDVAKDVVSHTRGEITAGAEQQFIPDHTPAHVQNGLASQKDLCWLWSVHGILCATIS
jgi:hypothetical protein